ncbi:hypothetical protein TSOC_013122, partial [Tetrabaena socialis]
MLMLTAQHTGEGPRLPQALGSGDEACESRLKGSGVDLARALIPRSVTVALALPIAAQLDAPLSITAAAVLLQGLLGANFGPNLMSAVGIK